jgi:hypothetical protein
MDAVATDYDKWLLARGLSQQMSDTKKGPENFWKDVLGEKNHTDVIQSVQDNPDTLRLVRSMTGSGSDRDHIEELLGAIHTLAFSKMLYESKDASTAAKEAVNAVASNYQFVGAARIPNQFYDDTRQLMTDRVRNITSDNIAIPKGYGGLGQPSAASYVSGLRSNPTWLTTKNEDGVVLIDNRLQPVLDKNGNPIRVTFGEKAEKRYLPTVTPAEQLNMGVQP